MKYLTLRLIACAALMAPSVAVMAQEAEERVTGHELCLRWQEQARGMFPVVCAETMTVPLFNRSSEDISDGQLVIGVYGGTDKARLAMLQIIHGMAREGKSVAIAFGPDRDRSSATMEFELYAHGQRITSGISRIMVDNTNGIRDGIRPEIASLVQNAYAINFPSGPPSGN